MKERFSDWSPSARSQVLLSRIDEVLTSYKDQGYVLTLRQLFYQLVSRDYIPNSVKSYSMIGDLVSNGRLAGYIDWDMIEDRVRTPSMNSHWDSPEQILRAASNSYYRDRWADQEFHIEVWCEKDAVSNILEPVCKKWDVTFMANRGYSSQSAMYAAYQRFRAALDENKDVRIIYFGDHDPSGMDMTRDIKDRMNTFMGGSYVEVRRVALNMDQVEEYDPPNNPAKTTDSRYQGYMEEFGDSSWELDALEPQVLVRIAEKAIRSCVDIDKFEEVEETEEQHKQLIRTAAAHLGEGDVDAL